MNLIRRNKKWAVGILTLVLGGITGALIHFSKSTELPSFFDGKKAYRYVDEQVKFGPRVSGTVVNENIGNFFIEEFKKMKWKAFDQRGEIDHPLWKKRVKVRNIIASFNLQNKTRVLLGAHYDTRPFGDNDLYVKDKPILGANDGGSGVGVLLELARVLAMDKNFKLGVDIILWDFEDTGIPSVPEAYCLGSKYWALHPHVSDYKADFGINLDMVGGFRAQFPREGFSVETGNTVYDLILSSAKELKFEKYFPERTFGHMVDDHVNVIKYRQIPMVDLIHMDEENQFFPAWHTMQDDMSQISVDTLDAVGKTIERTLYQYQNNSVIPQ